MQRLGAPLVRARGLGLALLIAGLAVGAQLASRAERYDRFHLPAFDGHVYAAMAERPAVFSVAPWGYRLLAPALAAALPFPHAASGFAWLTPLALVASAGLLFLWLRRLGHAEWAAWLGVAVFGIAAPVAEALRYEVLVEPVGVLVLSGFLLATASGAGTGVLALLAVLGALTKEVLIVLLPLALLWQHRGAGASWRSALRASVLVAGPAVALAVLLRLVWTPQLAGVEFAGGVDVVSRLPGRLADTLGAEGGGLLLYGLVPLALLGALRQKSGTLSGLGLSLWLLALIAPLLNPGDFHTRDVRRLELYALPGLIALALVALDRLRPHLGAARLARAPSDAIDRVAAAAALLLLATPAFLDGYKRIDLRGRTDASVTLATCRLSLEWAERLGRGEAIHVDLAVRGLRDDEPELAQLGRLRWFLRAGFAPAAARSSGPVAIQAARAALLVPLLVPVPLDVTLFLEAAEASRLRVLVNGQPLVATRVGPGEERIQIALPADALFRGDNLLELERELGGGALRLCRFSLVPSV